MGVSIVMGIPLKLAGWFMMFISENPIGKNDLNGG
jgi:hypothetical protein